MCSNPVSDMLDLIICKLKARKLRILHLDVDRKERVEGREIIRGECSGFKPLTNKTQIPRRCVKAEHFHGSYVNFAFAD